MLDFPVWPGYAPGSLAPRLDHGCSPVYDLPPGRATAFLGGLFRVTVRDRALCGGLDGC